MHTHTKSVLESKVIISLVGAKCLKSHLLLYPLYAEHEKKEFHVEEVFTMRPDDQVQMRVLQELLDFQSDNFGAKNSCLANGNEVQVGLASCAVQMK